MTLVTDSRYLVSALVSTYASERFIRGCLADLEAQTIADRVEIIIVDSCSPQNERAVVEEFQERYDNIKYIRTERRETIYQAWNRAAQAAAGRYLTNANADDRHRADALELLARELEDRPDCAVAYADCAVTRTENQCLETADIVGYFKWPDPDVKALFRCCYIGPQPMWRRSLHVRHGWFDADMRSAGDYEFWLRLASRGERFLHLPQVLGLYLDSPVGIEHSNSALSRQESDQARQRYWPASWGNPPAAGGTYLVPYVGKLPLVSIVMPTHNREHMLADALRSVIAQDYDNWEAIVVNDGGKSVAELAQSLDPRGRIRYFDHFASFGTGVARNTALRLARGDVICYLDDDDLYFPHHLSTVVRAIQETLAPFVYTDSETVEETLNGATREVRERQLTKVSRDFSRHALHVANYIPINTWAHRRDCLLRAGLFDERLCSHEDWDFLIRIARFFELKRIPKVTTEVRIRSGSMDSKTSREMHGFVDLYRQIYVRYPEFAKVPAVRRGRRECLAMLAEREHERGWTGFRRRGLLYLLRGLGGSLPLQRLFARYVSWRFIAVKTWISRDSRI